MEFIQVDKSLTQWLLKTLELKPECSFCHKKITKRNFGGVFSPNIVSCKNILCLVQATDVKDKKYKDIEDTK